jgi:hypothetical protein
MSGRAHFSQGTRCRRLPARASLFPPQLALSLQFGELGLLRLDLRPALLERRLHSGGVAVWGALEDGAVMSLFR